MLGADWLAGWLSLSPEMDNNEKKSWDHGATVASLHPLPLHHHHPPRFRGGGCVVVMAKERWDKLGRGEIDTR